MLNPFSDVDAEKSFNPEVNVVTTTQKEILDIYLGHNDKNRFVCVLGESGMGRTNTLRAVFDILSKKRETSGSIVPIYTNDSYLAIDSLFHRYYPDITRRELGKWIENDVRRFHVLVDYPFRYVKKDLIYSILFLLGLRTYPNVSVIISLTPGHLASMEGINLFFEVDNLLYLNLLRKEEISAMIYKRLTLFKSKRRGVERGSSYSNRIGYSPSNRSVPFNPADESPTDESVGIIRRELAPEDAGQSSIDRNRVGILGNAGSCFPSHPQGACSRGCSRAKRVCGAKRASATKRRRSPKGIPADVEMTREAMEYIYAVSGGKPRLAIITASTLFSKARENNCKVMDNALVELVSAQNGYYLEGNGCVLRTGLSKLMEVILEKFSGNTILEHNLLTYMAEKFGWDFNITLLRLHTLVRMRLIMDDLCPSEGWFRQYYLRQ